MTTKDLEKRLEKIEQRNSRVEADKAWEVSWTRRLLILLFTFFSIGLYMWVIKVPKPWMNAIVPTLGFFLSTLTMPFFKKWWLKKH